MPAVASAFAVEPNESPVAAEERSRLIADPGFGRVFTDHMATIRYSARARLARRQDRRAAPIVDARPRPCSITRRRSSRA
jgi:hypothetical protein